MKSYTHSLPLMLVLQCIMETTISAPTDPVTGNTSTRGQPSFGSSQIKHTNDHVVNNDQTLLGEPLSQFGLNSANEAGVTLADLRQISEIKQLAHLGAGDNVILEALERSISLLENNKADAEKGIFGYDKKEQYSDLGSNPSVFENGLDNLRGAKDNDLDANSTPETADVRHDIVPADCSKDTHVSDDINHSKAPVDLITGTEAKESTETDKGLTERKRNTVPDIGNAVKASQNLAVVSKRAFGESSSCSMDTIERSLTFSETIETAGGDVVLVCRGNVLVNKCEGMCNSNVWPDVNHYDGYQKECSCCRDASTRQRGVTLSSCTIGDAAVTGHFLTRTIVEPASCSCLACRN